MSIRRMFAPLVAAVALVAAATALAGPPEGEPLELTLANPEPAGRPASQIAETFARSVERRSKGRIVVKVVYEAGRTSDTVPVGVLEANLVRLVRTGRADLAIVPSRSFAAQGVRSFDALHTPFLITSDRAVARATTGSIARQLQSGLGRIGLVGLGLAPEGLRRPFGFGKPLVTPADFAGAKVRAIPSAQTYELLRALGARPVDLNGAAYESAADSGAVRGAESSLAILSTGASPRPNAAAAEVVFFPKVDVLVGHGGTMRSLAPEQARVLRAAAADARAWAVVNLTERRARAEFCRTGGTIVRAPAGAVAALEAKARPILTRMQRDPLTRRLIAQIRKTARGGQPVAPCGSTASPEQPPAKPAALLPAGVYRYAVSEAEIMAAGGSRQEARENAGVITVTITDDGRHTHSWDSPYPEWDTTCDTRKMILRGGLVVFELRGEKCGGNYAIAWKPVAGGVQITAVDPADHWIRRVLLGRVWTKIA